MVINRLGHAAAVMSLAACLCAASAFGAGSAYSRSADEAIAGALANINAATIYPDLVGIAQSIRYSNSTMMIDNVIGRANEALEAADRWIPIDDVTTAILSDSIASVSNTMLAKGYSHVPILDEKGRVYGVFSESTMLEAWIAGVNCTQDATLRDMAKFLPVEKHKADVFRFVSKNATVAQLRKLHEDALKKEECIGLVFVTETGREREPLLGILNIWDIHTEEKYGDI